MNRITRTLAAPALALAFALVVSTAILLLAGYSPFDVLSAVREDGLISQRIIGTLNRAGPYYISGVSLAVAFKMNLLNIGTEGQYKIGALVAAWAGASVSLPSFIHVPFILIVAAVTGAAYAAIPGILRATRGVSEVITTIMLNGIASGLGSYLLLNYFRAPPGEHAGTVSTEAIPSSGLLPSLNSWLSGVGIELPAGTRLQSYLFVAVIVGIAYYVIVWRTRLGYDLRASGVNAHGAEASGINSKRMIVIAMLLSGAAGGLVGLNNVLSDAGRYSDVAVVGGLGFTGIAVALLGRSHPVGIAFGAVLWGFMDELQTALSTNDLPKQITSILQGITVLSVVIGYEIVRRISVRQDAAALRRLDPPPPAEELVAL